MERKFEARNTKDARFICARETTGSYTPWPLLAPQISASPNFETHNKLATTHIRKNGSTKKFWGYWWYTTLVWGQVFHDPTSNNRLTYLGACLISHDNSRTQICFRTSHTQARWTPSQPSDDAPPETVDQIGPQWLFTLSWSIGFCWIQVNEDHLQEVTKLEHKIAALQHENLDKVSSAQLVSYSSLYHLTMENEQLWFFGADKVLLDTTIIPVNLAGRTSCGKLPSIHILSIADYEEVKAWQLPQERRPGKPGFWILNKCNSPVYI